MNISQRDQYTSYKPCSMCGRSMPIDYEKDYCPACEDDVLFREVREYIRSHDVTEFELAEIFQIPQSKVRKWIKDGRIEYVERENKMINTRCQRCGTPVTFGTLCTECMRIMNGNKEIAYTILKSSKDDDKNRMRFISWDEK